MSQQRRPGRYALSGHVWTFDFQFDQTVDGRSIKACNILDEFTRESLAGLVERSIDADTVAAALQQLSPSAAPRRICGWTTARR